MCGFETLLHARYQSSTLAQSSKAHEIRQWQYSTIYLKTKQSVRIGTGSFRQLHTTLQQYGIVNFTPLCNSVSGGTLFRAQVRHSKNTSIDELCTILTKECLQQGTLLEYAEASQILMPRQTQAITPNDPLAAKQYHLDRVRIKEAWNVVWNTTSSQNFQQAADSTMIIAVCDTGVDWEHEDLAGNIWTNVGETGRDAAGRDKRSNGIDDDRNGKIDDWHGWDFVGSISEDEREGGLFREDNDPKPRVSGILDPAEQLQHGTHVAATLAALMNNDKGGVGIAPRCRILPIKCSTDGTRVGGISRGYEAILYAAQMGAKVIVCSFGGGAYSRFEQDVINTATGLGALVVVAAGNSGKITDNVDFPASYNNVLCVGASTQADRAASFSDYGLKVHVFAPGESIMSAIIGNKYSNEWTGTSMATPIAAGIAALVRLQNPAWSPQAVIQQLRATSDNILTNQVAMNPMQARPLGYFGRINALNALTMRPAGLTITNANNGTAGGIVNDVQPITLTLQCMNLLAPAQNVRLLLSSLDGRASVYAEQQTLGNIGTNESRTATFRIQLEPSAFDGTSTQKTAEFVAIFQAETSNGTYLNYERVSVPYIIRPVQGAEMLALSLMNFGDVASPKRGNALLRNIGSEALTILTPRFSGANANDFSISSLIPSTLAAGSSILIPVDCAPMKTPSGSRTATISITAQTQGAVQLSGVQGSYDVVSEQRTYQEITDGISLRSGTTTIDDAQFDISVGFPFVLNGTSFDRITASSNGFCAIQPESSLVTQGATVIQPLSTFVRANAYIAAFATDLVSVQQTSDIRYKTEGTAPNRTFILQWRNMSIKTPEGRIDSSTVINVQLRLLETSNRIELQYGRCTTQRFVASEIGLRGSSAQDFHSRRISEDIAARWSSSVEARSFEDKCELTSTNAPTSGLILAWTPRPSSQPRTRNVQTLTRTIELRANVPVVSSVMTNILAQNSLQCSISPNPARDEATLKFVSESHNSIHVSIKNSLGAEVWESNFQARSGENILSLPVRSLSNGVYFVTLTLPKNETHQTFQQRFIVLR